MENPIDAPVTDEQSTVATAAPITEHVADELLVEEISIDGMCGVY